MHCPTCGVELEGEARLESGLLFCEGCRSVGCEGTGWASLLGGEAEGQGAVAALRTMRPLPGEDPSPCPLCGEHDLMLLETPTPWALAMPSLWRGQRCGGAWLRREAVNALRSQVAKERARAAVAGSVAPPAAIALELGGARIAFDDPRANAVALPAALAVGFVLSRTSFQILSQFLLSSWAHELGHATMSWLGSIPAVPTFLMTLTLTKARQPWASVLVGLGLAALVAWGVRSRHRFAMVVGAALVVLHVLLSYVASPAVAAGWMLFGGCGGELVISGLVMLAFYHPMPDRLRWDFWRYPALLLAACAFAGSTTLWMAVSQDMSKLPMGTAMGGSDDPGGDVFQLLYVHDWRARHLVNAYLGLSAAVLTVLAVAYAYYLRRALRQGPRVDLTPPR